METQNTKICPRCNAEYYAHIEMCADCEIPLVDPMTGERGDTIIVDGKELTPPPSSIAGIDPLTAPAGVTTVGGVEGLNDDEEFEVKYVDSGPTSRLKELTNVLKAAGIDSAIIPPPPNMCSSNKVLVVRAEEIDTAMKVVQQHWKTVHPELAAAMSDAEEGLCPACGAMVGDAKECFDCGLTLVIEDEG